MKLRKVDSVAHRVDRLKVSALKLSLVWAGLCVAALSAPSPMFALIAVGEGNTPVQDSGWPAGALEVANLKSRIGWWEGPPDGGGEYQFLYRGDIEVFQQTVNAFAAIRAPVLELV